jgi:hypothetical protein
MVGLGCARGTLRGEGTACDDRTPCRRAYSCVAGTCHWTGTDAGVDADTGPGDLESPDQASTFELDAANDPDLLDLASDNAEVPTDQESNETPVDEVSLPHEIVLDPSPTGQPTKCFDMHCCPQDHALVNLDTALDTLTCRRLAPNGATDCFVDYPTVRSVAGASARACPVGTFLHGLDTKLNLLTCCFDAALGFTRTSSEQQTNSLAGCQLTSDQIATGYDRVAMKLSCADHVRRNDDPPSVRVDPEAERTFHQLKASEHENWSFKQRNWLRRILNMPIDGSELLPVAHEVDAKKIVEEGVQRIKIHYTSLVDGTAVPAYLFLPSGYAQNGQASALIVFHGHDNSGKEGTGTAWTNPQHAAALYFAQQGLITLAPDTRTWNEYLPAEQEAIHQGHAAYVEDRLMAQTGHMGAMPQAMVLDAMRGVSVLKGVPGVDQTKISAAGIDVGGFQAMWLAALDTRISRVIAGGTFLGFGCLNKPNPPFSPGNHGCQVIPALSRNRAQPWNDLVFDAEDMAALIAPRPFFAMWGTQDQRFGGEIGFWANCKQAAAAGAGFAYEKLGVRSNFSELAPTADMGPEFDNGSAHQFLLDKKPENQIDYYTQCEGMHCCPNGKAVAGIDSQRNLLVCRDVVSPEHEECFVDGDTSRVGLHACPPGSWVRGIHGDLDLLVCCHDRGAASIPSLDESLDSTTTQQGFHVCRPDHFMTGLDLDGGIWLCGTR